MNETYSDDVSYHRLYIMQWWTTLASCWDGLSNNMREKLFNFILGIQFNFLKQGAKLKAWVFRCIQNSV